MSDLNVQGLSVGIPVRNQSTTIASTIEAILAQTVRPHEIVICENHSTDGTSEIVEKFREQVRIVRPPMPLEMMANWNYCVSATTGTWVSLLSGDDLALPNYCEVLSRGIRVESDAVLVRAAWQVINEDDAVVSTQRLLSVRRISRPPKTFLEQIAHPKVSFAAFAMRREAWNTAGGFPTTMKLNGDWALWLLLSRLGPFIYEDEIISRYRVPSRDSRIIERRKQLVEDEITIARSILPQAKPASVSERALDRAKQVRFRHFLSQFGPEMLGATRSEIIPLLEKLSEEVKSEPVLDQWKAGIPIPDPLSAGNFLKRNRVIRAIARKILWLSRRHGN